jgi:hypothetical protein
LELEVTSEVAVAEDAEVEAAAEAVEAEAAPGYRGGFRFCFGGFALALDLDVDLMMGFLALASLALVAVREAGGGDGDGDPIAVDFLALSAFSFLSAAALWIVARAASSADSSVVSVGGLRLPATWGRFAPSLRTCREVGALGSGARSGSGS